ncbi:MAG: hypothetical protein J7501_02420 [Bdellovibrio sp.]|nr:hypothetical protein [Bdellovibrio sp.]
MKNCLTTSLVVLLLKDINMEVFLTLRSLLLVFICLSFLSIAHAGLESITFKASEVFKYEDRFCLNEDTDCNQPIAQCESESEWSGRSSPPGTCDKVIEQFKDAKRRGGLIIFEYDDDHKLVGVKTAPAGAQENEFASRQINGCVYLEDSSPRVINEKCGYGSTAIYKVRCNDSEVGVIFFDAICTQTKSTPPSPDNCVQQSLKNGGPKKSSANKVKGSTKSQETGAVR